MKKGIVYTLIFMIVLSAAFTFALAFAFEAFKPNINDNKRLAEQRAVLYSFGLEEGLKDSEIEDRFKELIREGGYNGDPEGYTYVDNGEPKGYALPYTGAGLWGTIRGYLGVTADLRETTGLVFTAQNETPGLGGRIDESWYKEQFRGLPLTGQPIRYGAQEGYQVDAITGATQTSTAVLRMLNQMLAETLAPQEVK